MSLLRAIKQTNEWQLRGATYKKDHVFHYVGDYINNKVELSFNVNGILKTIEIPEPLKSLDNTYDEIKNGIVHYNTKTFMVDHTTVLFIDASWTQSKQTAICYCYMPYDVQSNTSILCDKLDVISGMITKNEECGVKVINKILALRLPTELLNVTALDNSEMILKKINSYLKDNPFTVIYCLAQSSSKLLENYAFDIQSANNVITCNTQYEPSFFNITYPVDVIINTTIDPKEMQALATQVKASKAAIDVIKTQLDEKSALISAQYEAIADIDKRVKEYAIEIDKAHTLITQSQQEINKTLKEVQLLKTQVETMTAQVTEFMETIQATMTVHNQSATSHLDIRAEITKVEEKINFDFGTFV